MIVDTSAIVAILRQEPERDRLLALLSATPARMSAGSRIELHVVVARKMQPAAQSIVDQLLSNFRIVIDPVTEAQVSLARDGFGRFGQASGHRARLNFGDCFAYALAKDTGLPLLFTGDDFSHTDVAAAA